MVSTQQTLAIQEVRVAGNLQSLLVIGGMTTLVLAQNQGCVGEGMPVDAIADSGVLRDYLAGVGPNVVEPTLERFIVEAEQLELATARLADELAAGNDGAVAKLEAQEMWLEAITVWQEVELLQVGPAGSSLRAVNGRDLRDEIYSWPTVNTCRVDQRTVDSSWLSDSFFEDNLVNAYGLRCS